jgi:kojibiose phosphorylase
MDKIAKHLYTPDGWSILKTKYDSSQAINEGTTFMIGNGYLGYRGTFAEDTKENYVGCIVTDTWDKADGKWEELCTVPNAFHTTLLFDDQAFTVDEEDDFERNLDLKNAITARKVKKTLGEVRVELKEEKFASYDNLHILAMRQEIQVDKEVKVSIHTGIDQDVWSINGDHFSNISLLEEPYKGLKLTTNTYNDEIVVLKKTVISGLKGKDQDGTYQSFVKELKANQTLVVDQFMIVVTSNDTKDPLHKAKELYHKIDSYENLKEKHQDKWAELWDNLDVEIHGNLVDQVGLRFNLYHAMIATPMHKPLPIGARGLSCQAYQGAAFWDQEIFNTPMYLYSYPQVAKNILIYRYNTLQGAKNKAKKHGYEGAFYAWISGKTGEELCPDFFFKDVITKRDIRNHFNLWQIHISPDIAYTIQKYVQVTKDYDFLEDYGIEMTFEIARFLASRVNYKPRRDRYELNQVQGPDEYHENIDNNAFTNYQAYFTFQWALDFVDQDRMDLTKIFEKLQLSDEEIELWRDIKEKLYLPKPNKDGLIEQFDGYFNLESIVPASDVTKRLIDKEEYYGWPNGITVYTQCLKQADTVQLFHLHPHLFDQEIVKKNYDYYEPRTLHFSSLSPSIHSIVASHIGYQEQAYQYFKKSIMIDLLNTNEAVSGGTFIGGIHTAANGASWQMVVNGFAGLTYYENHIELNPNLPSNWEGLAFKIYVRDEHLQIFIERSQVRIRKETQKPLTVVVCGKEYQLTKELIIGGKYD